MKHCLIVIMALVAASVFAGSLVEMRTGLGSVQKITLAWSTPTNAAAGVTGTTDPINGVINRIVFSPTTATTGAVYSVTISAQGVDILNALAGTLATGTVTTICGGVPVIAVGATSAVPYSVSDQYTVIVTNCGSSASGNVHIYVTP